MDDKKNKKYSMPEAEIVDFENNDIITLSCDEDETAGYDGENF